MKTPPLYDYPLVQRYARATTLLAVTAAAAILLSFARPAAGAPAEVPYGTPQHQTMRALARYLDATAQGALERAVDDARHGPSSDARFLFSIRSFARSAAGFHHQVDGYPGAPFE